MCDFNNVCWVLIMFLDFRWYLLFFVFRIFHFLRFVMFRQRFLCFWSFVYAMFVFTFCDFDYKSTWLSVCLKTLTRLSKIFKQIVDIRLFSIAMIKWRDSLALVVRDTGIGEENLVLLFSQRLYHFLWRGGWVRIKLC